MAQYLIYCNDNEPVMREPNQPTTLRERSWELAGSYFVGRKIFSHRRTKFPSGAGELANSVQQRAGEFQTEQVITLGMRDTQGLRPKRSGCLRKGGGGCQGSARDLEQNLRRRRQGATHSHQSSARTDVESSGKLQKLFAFFIPAAHKYRDRQGQSYPLPTFRLRSAPNQGVP